MSTLSELDAAEPDRLSSPTADEIEERRAISRTLRTMVVATLAVLVAIAVIVWATAPFRQANHLYATPSKPLAAADAKDAANKPAKP